VPRFTPWSAGIPVDPANSVPLLEDVLRPSLRQAFPLTEEDPGNEERFKAALDAMAQRLRDRPEN
jgi:hypothetical protein